MCSNFDSLGMLCAVFMVVGFWEGDTSGPALEASPQAWSAAKGGEGMCECQVLIKPSQHQHIRQRVIAFNILHWKLKSDHLRIWKQDNVNHSHNCYCPSNFNFTPSNYRSTCKGQNKHPGNIKPHLLFNWTISKILKHEHMLQYYSLHKNTYASRYTVVKTQNYTIYIYLYKPATT